MRIRLIAIALSTLAITACAKSDDKAAQEAAKTVQQGGQQTKEGAVQMAKGMEQVAQGLQQLAQSANGGKDAKPVDTEKLQALLPTVGGWTKGDTTGSQLTMPVPLSEASVAYTKGAMNVTVNIMDSAFNQLMMGPLSMALGISGFTEKTENGYKKAITVAGSPALEEWDSRDKSGTLTVIVGKRFIVEAKGTELDKAESLHAFIEKMDLNKLSTVK